MVSVTRAAVEVGPGDIVVVSSGVTHRFENVGPDRLELVCIHRSPVLIQEELSS